MKSNEFVAILSSRHTSFFLYATFTQCDPNCCICLCGFNNQDHRIRTATLRPPWSIVSFPHSQNFNLPLQRASSISRPLLLTGATPAGGTRPVPREPIRAGYVSAGMCGWLGPRLVAANRRCGVLRRAADRCLLQLVRGGGCRGQWGVYHPGWNRRSSRPSQTSHPPAPPPRWPPSPPFNESRIACLSSAPCCSCRTLPETQPGRRLAKLL